MKSITAILILTSLTASCAFADAINVNLGTADPFAVLAGSTVTNTGPSFVNGDLGLSPGSAITGFPPGTVSGTFYAGDAIAMQAQNDLGLAYGFAAGESCNTSLTGQNLGGLTLTPGVYCFDSSAQLTGTLKLDSQGNPNAVFIFQIGSTLTTASSSDVSFVNGGTSDVYWDVGSSATLGTTTSFAGNILAVSSITLNTGADIQCGRALAETGAVTMDSNNVSISNTSCVAAGTTPEPGTTALLALGMGVFGIMFYRNRSQNRS